MEGYSDSIRLYEGALNSAGTTQQKYNIWMQGTQAHINQLKATAEGLWIKIFDSKVIQNGIDLMTALVKGLEKVITEHKLLPSVMTVAMTALVLFRKELSFLFLDFSKWRNTDGIFKNLFSNISGGKLIEVINGFKGIASGFGELKKTGGELASLSSHWKNYTLETGKAVSITTRMKDVMTVLKSNTVLANIAVGTLKAGMLLLNAVVGFGIGLLLSWATSAIMKAINSAKTMREEVTGLLDAFKNNTQDNNNNIQSLVSMGSEYDKLSGKIGRTSEENEKLHDMNRQIADMFPELVSGYDEQGNAIINLKNGVKGLIDELRKKNEFENIKLVSEGGEKAFKSYMGQYDKLREQLAKYKEERETIENGDSSEITNFSDNPTNTLRASLEALRKEYERTKDPSILVAIEERENRIKKLNDQINVQNNKLKEAYGTFSPFIQAVLNTNEAYKKLDPSIQALVQDQMKLLDVSEFSSWDDMRGFIDKFANSLNSPELNSGVNKVKELKNNFTSGAIDKDTYIKEVTKQLFDLSSTIKQIKPDADITMETLMKLFNIDLSPQTKVYKDYDTILNEVAKDIGSYDQDIGKVNDTLKKHAETAEWDMDAIFQLAQTYPQLLDVLDDDKKLEETLIKIKKDRVQQTENVYKVELEAIYDYIKNAVPAYLTDVANFKTAMEAKAYYAKEFFTKINKGLDAIENRFYTLAMANGEDDEASYMLGKKARLMANQRWLQQEGMLDAKIDDYFRLKSLDANVKKYASTIGSANYDGKTNRDETRYDSDIKALSGYTSVIDDQNAKLETQENYLDAISRKLSQLSKGSDIAETIKYENVLLHEQGVQLDILNESKSKYTSTLDTIKQDFLSRFGTDISALSQVELNNIYDQMFSGERDFGVGEVAEGLKENFENNAEMFKSMVDSWFTVKDAITDVDTAVDELNSSMLETRTNIDNSVLTSINDSYNAVIEHEERQIQAIDLQGKSIKDTDLEGKMSILTQRARSYNIEIDNTGKYLTQLRSTTALTAEGQKKLDDAIAKANETLLSQKSSLADVNTAMEDLIETSKKQAESDALKLQSSLVTAIKNKYEKEKEKELDELEKDKETKLKLLKEQEDAYETYYTGRIKQLKEEIESLQDETQEKQDKLGELKKELALWQKDDSVYAKSKVKDVSKQIADLEKELSIKSKEKELKGVEDEQKEKEKIIKDGKEAVETANKEDIEKIKDKYKKLLDESNVYAEANKLIVSKNQTEILNMLTTYAPEYASTGQILGKSLANTMLEEVTKGIDGINKLTSGIYINVQSQTNDSSSTKDLPRGSAQELLDLLNGNLGHDSPIIKKYWETHKFKTGGLNTNTGYQWLDGTEREPEYVLKASDTKRFFDSIEMMKDISLPSLSLLRFDNLANILGFKSKPSVVIPENAISQNITMYNNTPFDVKNNFDSLNKQMKNHLKVLGTSFAM